MANSCEIISNVSISKAASILGVDVASAVAKTFGTASVEYDEDGELTPWYQYFRTKYKGQDDQIYKAMAILAEHAYADGNKNFAKDWLECESSAKEARNREIAIVLREALVKNKSLNVQLVSESNIPKEIKTTKDPRNNVIVFLKPQYRGKLIYAQSGTGKSYLADNVTVFDSDYLLGQVLGVSTETAGFFFKQLSIEQKKAFSELYRQAIKDKVAEGFTVITANESLLPEADVVVYNSNVAQTNKRINRKDRAYNNRYTDIDYHKRTLAKIHALEKSDTSKEYIELDENTYLADVLSNEGQSLKTFHDFHQNQKDAVVITQDEIIKSFLNEFGITVHMMQDYENDLPLFDALNRVINARDASEITDGVGYAIAFMMQGDSEVQHLLTESLAGFKGDLDTKLPIINRSLSNLRWNKKSPTAKLVLKEIGVQIAEALRTNFKKDVKDIKPKNKQEQSIWTIINNFFTKLRMSIVGFGHRKNVLEKESFFVQDIIEALARKDYSRIRGPKIKPGTSEQASPVDIAQALQDYPYEDSIVRKLGAHGIALAGGASIALQGDLYRPATNPLHDLDFNAGNDSSKAQLDILLPTIFPKGTVQFLHTIPGKNGDYTATYITLSEPFQIVKTGDREADLIGLDGKYLGHRKNAELQLVGGVQGKILDFFCGKTKADDYGIYHKIINGKDYLISESDAALAAKILWARPKDMWDYKNFKPTGFSAARVIWAHPGTGKTWMYKQGDSRIIDFDSEYKSRLGNNSQREALKKLDEEKYNKELDKLLAEAIEEADRTGKKLLISDLHFLKDKLSSIDLVTNISTKEFIKRSHERGEFDDSNKLAQKASINEAMKNVPKEKLIKTSGYLSNLFDKYKPNKKLLDSDTELYYTPKGTLYGAAYQNQIFLNLDTLDSLETPIHEYTHLWAKSMQYNNPKGWQSIVNLLKENTEEWNRVVVELKTLHAKFDLNDNLIASELLAQLSGKVNAAKLEQNTESLPKLLQALKAFWDWVNKNLFGIEKFNNLDEVTDRIIYDLFNQTDLKLPEVPAIDTLMLYLDADTSLTSQQLGGFSKSSNINGDLKIQVASDITADKLVKYLTGELTNIDEPEIFQEALANRLREKGYGKQFLKQIIRTKDDAIRFLTYLEAARLKHPEITPRTNRHSFSLFNLKCLNITTAIKALQYYQYEKTIEYSTSTSNDTSIDLHFDASKLKTAITLPTGDTIQAGKPFIKLIYGNNGLINQHLNDLSSYDNTTYIEVLDKFPLEYQEEIVTRANSGISFKFTSNDVTIYLLHNVVKPIFKAYYSEHEDLLNKYIKNSIFKFTDDFEKFQYKGVSPSAATASILEDLQKSLNLKEPAKFVISKDLKLEKESNWEKVVQKARNQTNPYQIVIDCYTNPIFKNPFLDPKLNISENDAIKLFQEMLLYTINPEYPLSNDLIDIFKQDSSLEQKIKTQYNQIIDVLKKTAKDGKQILFLNNSNKINDEIVSDTNPNHALLLTNFYTQLYKDLYQKDNDFTTTAVKTFSFEHNYYIPGKTVETEISYTNPEVQQLLDFVTYVEYKNLEEEYVAQGRPINKSSLQKEAQQIANTLLNDAISNADQGAIKLMMKYNTQQAAFTAELETLGFMTKNAEPELVNGHYDFETFYGNLNIFKPIKQQIEEEYLKTQALSLLETRYQEQLSQGVQHFSNKVFKILQQQYKSPTALQDKNWFNANSNEFFNWLRINPENIIQQNLKTFFAPIKNKQIQAAGVIAPKVQPKALRVGPSTHGEISVEYFKNLARKQARYKLPKNLLDYNDQDQLVAIDPDFIIRAFNGLYKIVLTPNFNNDALNQRYGQMVNDAEIIIQDGYRIDPTSQEKMYRFDKQIMSIWRDSDGTETIVVQTKNDPDRALREIQNLLISDSKIVTVEPFLTHCDLVNLEALSKLLSTINSDINALPVFRNVIKSAQSALEGNDLNSAKEYLLEAYKQSEDIYQEAYSRNMYTAYMASLETLGMRVPTQALQSIMAQSIQGYASDNANDVFVTRWQFWLQGSDLDIDKLYLLGCVFDKNGQFVHWSPLAIKNSLAALKASFELPIPNGCSLVNPDQTWKHTEPTIPILYKSTIDSDYILNELIEDYLSINKIVELGGFSSTNGFLESKLRSKYLIYGEDSHLQLKMIILSKILKRINQTNSFNIDSKYQNNSEVQVLIQQLNKHNRHTPSVEAGQNLNIVRMIKINEDPRNEISAYSSIDDAMKLFLNAIGDRSSTLLNLDDGISVSKGTEQQATGKDDVGVAANGLKVYLNGLGYFNKFFNSGKIKTVDDLLKSPKFKLNKLRLHYTDSKGNPVVESHLIVGVSDVKISQTGINFYNKVVKQLLGSEWEEGYRIEVPQNDAAISLSSIVSLATDNAKTQALGKINAGIELLCIHTYLTALGLSPQTVVDYTTSPIFEQLIKLLSNNIFIEQTGHIGKNTWKALYKWASENDWVFEFQQLYNVYQNAQEFKNYAGILKINQGISNDNEERFQIAYNFKNALMSRVNLYNYKTADGNNTACFENGVISDPDRLAELILINAGFYKINNNRIIYEPHLVNGQDLLKSNLVKEIEEVNQIIKVNKINIEAPIEMDRFFSEFTYRNNIIKIYNIFKGTINIYDAITDTPHIYSMLKKYALTLETYSSFIPEIKFIQKIAPKLYNPTIISNNRVRNQDEEDTSRRAAYQTPALFDKRLIKGATRAYNDWELSTFLKSLNSEFNFKVQISGIQYNVDFNTDEGLHQFVQFVDQVLIPVLQVDTLQAGEYNAFLNALERNTTEAAKGKPFWGLNINLRVLNSKDINDATLRTQIQQGFDKLEGLTLKAILSSRNQLWQQNAQLNKITLGEIFYIYNLLMQRVSPKVQNFSGLFSKLLIQKDNLADRYENFTQDIAKGKIEINIPQKNFMVNLFAPYLGRTNNKMQFNDNTEIEFKQVNSNREVTYQVYLVNSLSNDKFNNANFDLANKFIEALKRGLIQIEFKEECK